MKCSLAQFAAVRIQPLLRLLLWNDVSALRQRHFQLIENWLLPLRQNPTTDGCSSNRKSNHAYQAPSLGAVVGMCSLRIRAVYIAFCQLILVTIMILFVMY